jgi:hypothetical protein
MKERKEGGDMVEMESENGLKRAGDIRANRHRRD